MTNDERIRTAVPALGTDHAYESRASDLEQALATVAKADIEELSALKADISYKLEHARARLRVIETAWLERKTRPEPPS